MNHFVHNPVKLSKIHYRETDCVYDIETYPDEENGDSVHFSVGNFLVPKTSISLVYRDLTDHEVIKLKGKVSVCRGEDCNDKMLYHTNKRWKVDPERKKSKLISDIMRN